MVSVQEAIMISYSYHIQCQGSRNRQTQLSVIYCLFVDIRGSVAFVILPIDMENASQLSKRNLSTISIS